MFRPKEELPPRVRRRLWALRVVVAAVAFAVIIVVVAMTGGDTETLRWLLLALLVGLAAEWIAEVLVRHRLRTTTGPGDRTEPERLL